MTGGPDTNGADTDGADSRAWAPLDSGNEDAGSQAASRPPLPSAQPSPPGTAARPAAGPWPPPPMPGTVLPPPTGQWPPPAGHWAQPAHQPAYGVPFAFGGTDRTGPLPVHPMSVGDILDGAFKLLKANARTVLLIVASVVVPLHLLSAFIVREQVSLGFLNILRDPTVAGASQPSDFGTFANTLTTIALAAIAAPFTAGAVSRVVAASYLGRDMRAGEALRATVRRFPALFVAFILVHLAEAVGLILCILPVFPLIALFTPVAPAISIEELGPIRGMRRSWNLVKPRLFPVLGVTLLAGLIASVLGNLLGGLPTAIGTLFGGSFAWLAIALGAILAELISAPIIAIVATLIYFDARIRNEGFDLQIMAADLERGPVR